MAILDQFSLKGQKAVVTGAGKGIGRGIALCLAEAGADVVVASRTPDDLADVTREIEARGRRGFSVTADVTDPAQVAALADAAAERLDGLTIWINNAGGQPDNKQRPFLEVWSENFDDQITLNLKSVWSGVIEASRRLSDGGTIINISSTAARPGIHAGHALYAATKAAVNNLTGTLAGELGPRLRVNAIAPGPVLTETFYQTMELDRAGALAILPDLGLPLQRYGTPEDIGAAVVFLASPAASWISGQCLYVSGGD